MKIIRYFKTVMKGESAMEVIVHKTADGREFVRTPDDVFADLPDFPYAPNYVEIDGIAHALCG